MTHHYAHAAVEIAEDTEKVQKGVSKASTVAKAISLPNAFRKYRWLSLAPELNRASNFRGIVISARWKAVYQFSTRVHHLAEKAEKFTKPLGQFAAVGGAMLTNVDEFEKIWNSKASAGEKGVRYSSLLTSTALRAITGTLVVPETQGILSALSWTCGTINRVTGNQSDQLDNLRQFADDYKQSITTTFQHFSDGNEIYHLIDAHVNPWVWKNIVSKLPSR